MTWPGQCGFTIHAPEDLEQWLAPFSPTGDDDNAQIAAVARLMGTTLEEKARDVLHAVKMTPQDIEFVLKAVNSFLDNAPDGTAQPKT